MPAEASLTCIQRIKGQEDSASWEQLTILDDKYFLEWRESILIQNRPKRRSTYFPACNALFWFMFMSLVIRFRNFRWNLLNISVRILVNNAQWLAELMSHVTFSANLRWKKFWPQRFVPWLFPPLNACCMCFYCQISFSYICSQRWPKIWISLP